MNTLNKISLIVALLTSSFGLFAQDERVTEQPALERDPKAREKIEAARIGMITNKLGLSPEQAEKFWPIYREFAEKRMGLRQEFKTEQQKIKPENANPEQQKRLVELGLNLKQKELDLEKTYSGRLLNVISAEQMLNLRTAERDFQRMIIQQLQQRRDMQQRKEVIRDKNQNLRQKKN
jgi:hypothetical protein